MMAQDSGPVIRGRHVLFAMLGLFGIVIAVNLVFVYLALDTFTGVSRENPYQEGLAYNQVLAARDAQRDLGWQGRIALAAAASGEDRIILTLTDKSGAPLRGMTLGGTLRRPTHEGMDRALSWREDSAGRYVAVTALPARGNWDLEVAADDGHNPPFEMKARLWFE
jgi:nitrogen fixation protein FixH